MHYNNNNPTCAYKSSKKENRLSKIKKKNFYCLKFNENKWLTLHKPRKIVAFLMFYIYQKDQLQHFFLSSQYKSNFIGITEGEKTSKHAFLWSSTNATEQKICETFEKLLYKE